MNKKILGMFAPTVITVLLIGFIVGMAYLTGNISNDGWAALGILIICLFVYFVVFLLSLIIGTYLHIKKQDELGKGLLFGSLVLIGSFGLVIIIFMLL